MRISIPLQHYMSDSVNLFGYAAEIAVKRALLARGFKVLGPHKHGHDLTAIDKNTGKIIKIEVKASRQGADKRYSTSVYKPGEQNCYKADYVFWLVFPKFWGGFSELYIIPTKSITSKQLRITSHPKEYRGKWHGYKNAWRFIYR